MAVLGLLVKTACRKVSTFVKFSAASNCDSCNSGASKLSLKNQPVFNDKSSQLAHSVCAQPSLGQLIDRKYNSGNLGLQL